MALVRRSGARFEANIWPGFVDALTALLLIVIFVLSIFMIVQFSLREQVTGQERRLNDLTSQLSSIADVLAVERQAREDAESELGVLRATLGQQQDEQDRLRAALAAMAQARTSAEDQAAALQTSLDSLSEERRALTVALAAARGEIDQREAEARRAAAEAEALQTLINDLREEGRRLANVATGASDIDAERRAALERARAAEAEVDEAERLRLLQKAAAEALRQRLEDSQAELDAMSLALEQARREAQETLTLLAAAEGAKQALEASANTQAEQLSELEREAALRRIAEQELSRAERQTAEERRRVALLNEQVRALRNQLGNLQSTLDEAEARDREQKIQIANLGERLNAALAQKVSDLERFQSEFFRRMDQIIGGREGIARVGDRFIFQSEVLFDVGSSDLDPAGFGELATLGEVLREVTESVPEDLDWILRVDGHTDDTPIRGGGRFSDNWALSQARALSVVRYLIDEEGVPPQRLAATGFGEHQPLAAGDSSDVRARNRRIEFKFTER